MKTAIPIVIGTIWWVLVAVFYAQTRTELLLCVIAWLLTGIAVYVEQLYNLIKRYD